MLKVEVGKGRFYVSRHDAKPSSGAEHDGRSAGMVREEGSVHRHSQELLARKVKGLMDCVVLHFKR